MLHFKFGFIEGRQQLPKCGIVINTWCAEVGCVQPFWEWECGQCSADHTLLGAPGSERGEAFLPVLDMAATVVKDPTCSSFHPLLSGCSRYLWVSDSPFWRVSSYLWLCWANVPATCHPADVGVGHECCCPLPLSHPSRSPASCARDSGPSWVSHPFSAILWVSSNVGHSYGTVFDDTHVPV